MNEEVKEPQGTVTVDKNMIYHHGLQAATFYAEAKRQREEREKAGEIREDGFFMLTFEDIRKEIDMSVHIQMKVTNHLAAMGVLRVRRLGLPSRRHICLDK